MLEIVALWGFVGGLIRAMAGFASYGKPEKRKYIPLSFLITGFVGIVCAFAVFYFEGILLTGIFWKTAVFAVLTGYVGVDILNSLFVILKERGVEL